MANRWGNNGKQWQTLFSWAPKSLKMVTAPMKLRHLLLGRKVMTNLDNILKKQRYYFANKGLSSQGYGFSSSHVWMWELDCEEGWVLKNWCFWIVLEKTLESPLDSKEIKPINPKGNQSWIFIGKTDAEAPIFWPRNGAELTHWNRPWCWERLKLRVIPVRQPWALCLMHQT